MGHRTKVLKCDGAAKAYATTADVGRDSENLPLEPCDRPATVWVPETTRAYCEYHKEERGDLRRIDWISFRAFNKIWARQQVERG